MAESLAKGCSDHRQTKNLIKRSNNQLAAMVMPMAIAIVTSNSRGIGSAVIQQAMTGRTQWH